MREPTSGRTPPALKLRDADVRLRLSQGLPAVVRMLEGWGINRTQRGELLAVSPRTLQRVRTTGAVPTLGRDQLTRLSLIVGIYRAVYTLYDPEVANGWMQRRNARPPFSGQSPLSYVLEGDIPALLAVRRLVEADLGGTFSSTPEAVSLARLLLQPDIHLEE